MKKRRFEALPKGQKLFWITRLCPAKQDFFAGLKRPCRSAKPAINLAARFQHNAVWEEGWAAAQRISRALPAATQQTEIWLLTCNFASQMPILQYGSLLVKKGDNMKEKSIKKDEKKKPQKTLKEKRKAKREKEQK